MFSLRLADGRAIAVRTGKDCSTGWQRGITQHMGRRSSPGNAETLRRQLVRLLTDFEQQLLTSDLRSQVRSLAPAYNHLADLGASLPPSDDGASGFARLLSYLRRFQGEVIAGEELRVVSGIHDYPRRIRELRVEHGWKIMSGLTLRELREEELKDAGQTSIPDNLRPEDYVLVSPDRDEKIADHWQIANRIRGKRSGVRAKILEYFLANVGRPVTGEDLRYVANDKTEWARRTRELRTEHGWDIATNMTERPDLPMGTYVLQSNQQAPPHDRRISDKARIAVLKRDDYSCRYLRCDFDAKNPPPGPRRRLELHHVRMHANRGSNEPDNLVTLCNVHHDEVHAGAELKLKPL